MSIQQANNQHAFQTKQNKPQIYVRIHVNNVEIDIVPYQGLNDIDKEQIINSSQNKQQTIILIKIQNLMKIISATISKKKVKTTKFLTILINVDKKQVNLLKLKIKSPEHLIKLKKQDQHFYLDVSLVEIGNQIIRQQKKQGSNSLLQLSNEKSKYKKIVQKLKRLNQIFTGKFQSLNQDQKKSYDIVYLFSQPLVYIQLQQRYDGKNYEQLQKRQYFHAPKEVTFQKEYNTFINKVLKEKFFQNIAVDMLVATETNIKHALIQKCNVLHFACHGKVHYLQIQQQRNIGFLDIITSEKLIRLLEGKTKPKIIIFNSCLSSQIAYKIHSEFNQISTIGYNDQANDKYCQLFTERFYTGIYLKNKTIMQIFNEIKQEIHRQNPKQAAKLVIYCNSNTLKLSDNQKKYAIQDRWNVQWAYLENLGPSEPIGMKKMMYQFIRDFLLSKELEFLFIYGVEGCGKSIFIKKVVYYTMHRQIFQHKIMIDLSSQNPPIANMLKFKLKYKKLLFQQINLHKQKNIILVLDHCNSLVKNQSQQFLKFIKQLWKKMSCGKIIIISDHIQPLLNINKDLKQYRLEQLQFDKNINVKFRDLIKMWYLQIISYVPKYEQLEQYKLCSIMKTLKTFTPNIKFLDQVRKNEQFYRAIQNQQCKINLQQSYNIFYSVIIKSQRLLLLYIKSGYYSRNAKHFSLIQFFPQFLSSTSIQRIEKDTLYNQISQIYQKELKFVIQKMAHAFGKFQRGNCTDERLEEMFGFILDKLIIIINVVYLLQDHSQLQSQLFNSYTIIAKLMTRHQNLFNTRPKLFSQHQNIRLKIYLIIYCLYKNKSPQSKTVGFGNISQLNINRDSYSLNDFQLNYLQRDSINQYNRQSIVQAQITTQMSEFDKILLSEKNNSLQTNQCEQFQIQLKQEYGQSDYWTLITWINSMDNQIRIILNEEIYFNQKNIQRTSLNQRIKKIVIQIRGFYLLYDKLNSLLLNSQNNNLQNDQQFNKKVVFTHNQLDLVYLVGLRIIYKYFNTIDYQYAFEYQQLSKQIFTQIQQILIHSQKIIKKIHKNFIKNYDFSYRKLYKEYLEIYIDLRFKLQQLSSKIIPGGQKQALIIFTKLLKYSEQAKLIQLKNRIEQYMQKSFFNKCSILISEPLIYIRQKSTNHSKKRVDKKFKGEILKVQKQKQSKQSYEYPSNDRIFHPLNIMRYSSQMSSLLKQKVQKTLKNQIHIDLQTFTFEKLLIQNQQKTKQKLIYLLICDCYEGKSQNHQSIYLESFTSQSVKYQLRELIHNHTVRLPIAQVIILLGSNTDRLKYLYRDYSKEHYKKTMAFISLNTKIKKPQLQTKFQQIQPNNWHQYLQKQICIHFLTHFWIKFCQIYFDQQHQTFEKQVIKSFNIAKKQSLILVKKKYCQGIKQSELQQQIDKVINSNTLCLDFFPSSDLSSPPIIIGDQKSTQSHHQYQIQKKQQNQPLLSQSLIKREQQLISLYHHEIGSNKQIYQFLEQVYLSLQVSDHHRNFVNCWIKYHPQINQTNLYTFSHTIYYKLLRNPQFFQDGVHFYDMTNFHQQHHQLDIHPDQQNITQQQYNIEDREIQIGNIIQNQQRKTKKKFQIYYNVPDDSIYLLLESFQQKDCQYTVNLDRQSVTSINQNKIIPQKNTVFRLIIVESPTFNQQLLSKIQQLLKKNYHIQRFHQYYKQYPIEQHYNVFDTMLKFGKRIEDFRFIESLKTIYGRIFSKKETKQDKKIRHPKEIKDKLISYFEKIVTNNNN